MVRWREALVALLGHLGVNGCGVLLEKSARWWRGGRKERMEIGGPWWRVLVWLFLVEGKMVATEIGINGFVEKRGESRGRSGEVSGGRGPPEKMKRVSMENPVAQLNILQEEMTEAQ
ncbi:hypothetical protein HAX54_031091 [Datura stramonium]|uniref:Uncharacterized protein n=1 Tax=Datura stramonium TaxID=4076 RepID=A0ABS8V910_DATST|nr:hypothetical protein [Datura stramonium]